MAILGVDVDSKTLRWVEVHSNGTSHEAGASGRIVLTGTRDAEAMKRFAKAFRDVLNEIGPTKIAIKEKSETGRMRAGAASLKMEGLALYLADVPVGFIGGSKINKCQAIHPPRLKDAELEAFKAAVCAAT